jgi:hypothetical protein
MLIRRLRVWASSGNCANLGKIASARSRCSRAARQRGRRRRPRVIAIVANQSRRGTAGARLPAGERNRTSAPRARQRIACCSGDLGSRNSTAGPPGPGHKPRPRPAKLRRNQGSRPPAPRLFSRRSRLSRAPGNSGRRSSACRSSRRRSGRWGRRWSTRCRSAPRARRGNGLHPTGGRGRAGPR